jgi:hypothetical protein
MVKQFITNFKIKNMNKIEELKSVIGKDVSENRSPTCRAKLIKVNKATCLFESVQSPYITSKYEQSKVGVRYRVPNAWAWNAFFF